MTEFYHPGYRKRIWTTPSVDLRNENTVKKSSFKLAAQGDYATGSSSPGRSPKRQNAQNLRLANAEFEIKQQMPPYIESPTQKQAREKEERKAKRHASKERVPVAAV